MNKIKLFLFGFGDDIKLCKSVAEHLNSLGVTADYNKDIKPGTNLNAYYEEIFKDVQIFIHFFGEGYIEETRKKTDLGLLPYAKNEYFEKFIEEKSENSFVLPVIPENLNVILPSYLSAYAPLKVSSFKETKIISNKIEKAVQNFKNQIKVIEKDKETLKKRIEVSAADFIEESLELLKKKEKTFYKRAFFSNIIGYLFLIFASLFIYFLGSVEFPQNVEWGKIFLYVSRNILILLILFSASRYSFSLSKTYMNESLKNSDRIHAISFGKFYLRVFEDKVEKNELKDIFQEWNVNNPSPFLNLEGGKIDNSIVEKTVELIKLIKK